MYKGLTRSVRRPKSLLVSHLQIASATVSSADLKVGDHVTGYVECVREGGIAGIAFGE